MEELSWLATASPEVILVVTVYFLITKYLPKLQEKFASTLDNQQTKFLYAMEKQQSMFAMELKETHASAKELVSAVHEIAVQLERLKEHVQFRG